MQHSRIFLDLRRIADVSREVSHCLSLNHGSLAVAIVFLLESSSGLFVWAITSVCKAAKDCCMHLTIIAKALMTMHGRTEANEQCRARHCLNRCHTCFHKITAPRTVIIRWASVLLFILYL